MNDPYHPLFMTLTPDGYMPRLVEKDVSASLRAFGAVCIVGPKYCGKTWVGLNASESAFMMGGVNRYGVSNRDLADADIRIALDGEPPHMIDEWQEIPRIWDAVRSEVDAGTSKGRFVLTGSSTPVRKGSAPVHSGTGRIRRLRMRTMSLLESGDSTGSISLRAIMDGEDIGIVHGGVTLERLAELVVRGGWPGNLSLPPDDCAVAVGGYLDSIVEDACGLDDVRRKESSFRMVLRSLARNECTLASMSRIQADTGVPVDAPSVPDREEDAERRALSINTVTDYIDVLDRLFLLEDQPAFDPNLKSSVRVGKTAKRHLADPSLAVALLGAGKERLTEDLPTMERMFESLCERDLQIYARAIGARLFHYRDEKGMEADAIVKTEDGRWGAFEIRLGANKADEAASNLLEFRDAMERRGARSLPSALCVICGTAAVGYRRGDGVYVVPIASLGPRSHSSMVM